MIEKLTKLYNTLAAIETKGESTKLMSNCLRYVEQLVNEEREKENATETPPVTEQM